MSPGPTRFTLEDADRAHDEWGENCGPGAIAAVMGLTLDELRPHMGDFEQKRYTNPTLMWDVLNRLGVKWRASRPSPPTNAAWPNYGLARIQWEGPWTEPGVPMRARYRFTHWVGVARGNAHRETNIGIFDINCMNNGSGWVALKDWSDVIVPAILKLYPRANGRWHITHAVEIQP